MVHQRCDIFISDQSTSQKRGMLYKKDVHRGYGNSREGEIPDRQTRISFVVKTESEVDFEACWSTRRCPMAKTWRQKNLIDLGGSILGTV